MTPRLCAAGRRPGACPARGAIFACLALSVAAPTPANALVEREFVESLHHGAAANRLWFVDGKPGEQARAMLTVFSAAASHGLDPGDYAVDRIEALWSSAAPRDLDELDQLLTAGLLRYADDIRFGRLRRATGDGFASFSSDSADEAGRLVEELRASANPMAHLLEIAPQHRHYRMLRRELVRLRQIESAGGWPTLDQGPPLRPGDADVRVRSLQQRLQTEGDLAGDAPRSNRYDGRLVDAVRSFQRRHGLLADGVVGRATLAALAIKVGQRIRTVEMNLERWRQTNHELGARYVLVGIAGFTLQAIEHDRVRLEMPVIVGSRLTPTPVFSSDIHHLELNPFWNVPLSIVRGELQPKLAFNPDWLRENHFRLFESWQRDAPEIDPASVDWVAIGSGIARYRIRQDPGPWNPLGRIKFVLPNSHDVYLHDTPHRDLFHLPDRALSHGCVRLARPMELAVFALGESKENESIAPIADAIDAAGQRVIALPEKLPVHLVYRTAWVDIDGALRFNADVYGRDAELRAVLSR